MERSITHLRDPETGITDLIRTNQEEQIQADWQNAWTLRRIKGLTPNQKTILFQFANGMLVNNERLHRLGKEDSPNCTRCGKLDDRCHLLRCEFNKQVNRGVMKVIEEVTDRWHSG